MMDSTTAAHSIWNENEPRGKSDICVRVASQHNGQGIDRKSAFFDTVSLQSLGRTTEETEVLTENEFRR